MFGIPYKLIMKNHVPNSNKTLSNKRMIRELLIEAITKNDLATYQDVLVAYLRTSSKLAISKKTKLGRTTLYDLMDTKKPFNPTLETIGKIFEDLAS